MKITRRRTFGGVTAIALAGSIWLWSIQGQAQTGTGAQQASVPQAHVNVLDELSNAFETVAEAVRPAVVSIEVTQKVKIQDQRQQMPRRFREFFGDENALPPELREFFGGGGATPREFSRQGMGSGVIIDAQKGYILTNNHVVGEADEIKVTLTDNREFTAKVIGKDPNTDIAVVQIKADNLTAAKMGSSTDLKVGQIVMAVGSPFALGGTVTQGIISATGRQTGILGQSGFENFIQTDAAVNPGNSGGPLVNLRGEIIGINTAIATGSGAFAGVSFAVPVDLAKQVSNSLITTGKVSRGYLGVAIGPIDQAWTKRLNLDAPRGAFVDNVTPGGPADKAGLRETDVIVELNGQRVTDYSNFRYEIANMAPGTKVSLTVLREGENQNTERVTVDVVLGERPKDEELDKLYKTDGSGDTPSQEGKSTKIEELGFSAQNLTAEMAKSLNMGTQKGVIITDVDADSPAARKGLQSQMVITRVEKQDVANVAELKAAIQQALKQRGSVLLRVFTEGASRFVLIEPREK